MGGDLVKRLRSTKRGFGTTIYADGALVNPDGPDAADRIEALEASCAHKDDMLRKQVAHAGESFARAEAAEAALSKERERPHVPAPAGETFADKLVDESMARWEAEKAKSAPEGEVEAAVGRVRRAISHTDYKLVLSEPDYDSNQDCFVAFTADLRTLLSALTASQAREARAVEAVKRLHELAVKTTKEHGSNFGSSYREGVNDQGYRWIKATEAALSEFIDNNEDDE